MDLSPEQTRAIVAASGCRVLEGVELYDGAVAFEVDCNTHDNKVQLLEALADADAELPDVRRIAEDVTRGLRTDEARAATLHAYVKDRVAFVKEKRETFSPTLRTLEVGMGDCDDSARALMALLRTLDIPARLQTLPPRGHPDPPLHVAAQVQLGGQWRWLETSIDAQPFEHPLQAAKRLGIHARPELGKLEVEGGPLWAVPEWMVIGATVAVAGGLLWWMSGTR